MTTISIAVCDEDKAYGAKLTEYAASERRDKCHLYFYSNPEIICRELGETSFDVVLLGKGFWGIQGLSDFKNSDKGKNMIFLGLSEGKSTPPAKLFEGMPMIAKYQSGEQIVREVYHHVQNSRKEEEEIGFFREERDIVGIYSPCHSLLQTPFALTLAKLYANDKKVLYLNFAECAGFKYWFSEDYKRDMGDLLYMISVDPCNFSSKLGSVLYTMEQIDYVAPIADSQLLCEASPKDYLTLLGLLVDKTEYTTIILDFGIMIPGFFSLLEQCTSIYMLLNKEILANGATEHFKETVRRAGRSQLLERIHNVTFAPMDATMIGQQPLLQQWIWGKLGDTVREAMREKFRNSEGETVREKFRNSEGEAMWRKFKNSEGEAVRGDFG
ncbi:hypothetical protein LQZ18_15120 [Lachnospiraceae bacterium ZAX-1]